MKEIKYEIAQEIGTLSTSKEWTKEVNLVSWNGADAKLDIRSWKGDHEQMSKGITLSDEEGKKLYELLKGLYE